MESVGLICGAELDRSSEGGDGGMRAAVPGAMVGEFGTVGE